MTTPSSWRRRSIGQPSQVLPYSPRTLRSAPNGLLPPGVGHRPEVRAGLPGLLRLEPATSTRQYFTGFIPDFGENIRRESWLRTLWSGHKLAGFVRAGCNADQRAARDRGDPALVRGSCRARATFDWWWIHVFQRLALSHERRSGTTVGFVFLVRGKTKEKRVHY